MTTEKMKSGKCVCVCVVASGRMCVCVCVQRERHMRTEGKENLCVELLRKELLIPVKKH